MPNTHYENSFSHLLHLTTVHTLFNTNIRITYPFCRSNQIAPHKYTVPKPTTIAYHPLHVTSPLIVYHQFRHHNITSHVPQSPYCRSLYSHNHMILQFKATSKIIHPPSPTHILRLVLSPSLHPSIVYSSSLNL